MREITDMEMEKEQDQMDPRLRKAAVEAVLFAAGDGVDAETLAKAIGLSIPETHELVLEMMREYEQENRGIRITPLEDGYQLCTKKELYPVLLKLMRSPRKISLTDVVMETLSIIAYRQPVTKLEIEKIRGVKSDHAVNKLVEYGLVEEMGRLDAPGRPILFGTTLLFLRHFGLSSIDQLPKAGEEVRQKFLQQAQNEAQRRVQV